MSVDDALSRMELVGHDFYLFADADTGERRRRLPAQGLRLRRDPPGAVTRRDAPCAGSFGDGTHLGAAMSSGGGCGFATCGRDGR